MKVNGNLRVLGIADLCLPTVSENEYPTLRDNQIFFDEAGQLCFKKNNTVVVIATKFDTDLSKVFGDFITSYGNLNTSAINKVVSPLFNFKNNEKLLDLFEHLVSSIEDIKNISDATQNTPLPSLDLPHIHGEGLVKKIGNEWLTVPEYKVIESKETKRIHIINHNLNKKYCWVQVINHKDQLLSTAEYQLTFHEANRFSIKLNTESSIVILVS